MKIEEIRQEMKAAPLAQALHDIQKNAVPEAYQRQIIMLENELKGDVPYGSRTPLKLALEQMREAARQAILPLNNEILKVIAEILESENIGQLKKPAKANNPAYGVPRPRIDGKAIGDKIMGLLPEDVAEGIAGNQLAKECSVSYLTMRKHLRLCQDKGMIVKHGSGSGTTWHRAAK